MKDPENQNEEEQIAIIAYRIYESEGYPEGRSDEHWARAARIAHAQRTGAAIDKEGDSPADALTPPSSMVP